MKKVILIQDVNPVDAPDHIYKAGSQCTITPLGVYVEKGDGKLGWMYSRLKTKKLFPLTDIMYNHNRTKIRIA